MYVYYSSIWFGFQLEADLCHVFFHKFPLEFTTDIMSLDKH